MAAWQYLKVEVREIKMLDENLEHYGKQEWELVTVTHEGGMSMDMKPAPGSFPEMTGERWDSWMLFFKKPL